MVNNDNDALARIIKEYPVVEAAINKLADDNKKITSMFIHELRNPLSLIKGTLQYIETKHPEAKEFKYWDQLCQLVNDQENMMSDFSQFNTQSNINRTTTDLLTLITAIKDSFMPQAINRQIDLSLEVEDGSAEYFLAYSCDAPKMKQALNNLIKNAFEATSSGDFIRIELGCLPEQGEASKKLFIRISDNGPAIPEDEIGSIFDPFVTYKKGGSGIGLALVKRISELHYGSVCVHSDEKLTSFEIRLPSTGC